VVGDLSRRVQLKHGVEKLSAYCFTRLRRTAVQIVVCVERSHISVLSNTRRAPLQLTMMVVMVL
jgi:hypothetical protein